MAFPAVAETSSGGDSSAGETATVTMPSTKSGKLLVVMSANGDGTTFTWPNGWTEIEYGDSNTSAGSLAYRDLNDTEGASIDVTLSSSQNWSWTWTRVTGGASGAPDSDVAVQATAATQNPPSLTPAGGQTDYLWIAAMARDNGSIVVDGYPTNYTLGQDQYDYDDASANVPATAMASRQLNASVEDPGAFGVNTDEGVAFTVAVGAASAGGGGAPYIMLNY